MTTSCIASHGHCPLFCTLPLSPPSIPAAFSDGGTFDLRAALEKLQGQLCAAVASEPSAITQRALITPGGGSAGDLGQLVQQLAGRLCDGSAASSSLSLASLAPMLEEAFKGGVAGLAVQADALLGTDGALSELARAAANGTVSSPQQLGPALDAALEKLLTSPAGDTAAGWVSDALSELSDWLNKPIGGGSGEAEAKPEAEAEAKPETGASGPASGGDDENEEESSGGGDDLGGLGDFGDILGGLFSDLIGSVGDASDSLFGLGGLIQGSGGEDSGAKGTGEGTDDSDAAADNPLAAVGGIVQSLVDAFDGGEDGSDATPGDLLNQLIGAVGGALGKNTTAALKDVDLTALIPVFTAVLRDPAARAELPALVGSLVGGGTPSMQDLGPIISAVLSDPEAAKAIPSLLALMNGLGVPLQLN